jgi:hypothetical protein
MMSRRRKVNHLNQVIEEHGFCEVIFDKGAIFELLTVLREALEQIETSPEKSLVLGVLIDEKVQSSIAPGVLSSRVTSVVGVDITELIPEIKTYNIQQLEDRIDNFLENFDI